MEDEKCDSCRLDAQEITKEELDFMLSSLKEWVVFEDNEVKKIKRVYKFKDFVSAIKFSNKVGDLAENYNHHPAILTEWGKVTITWWSHGIEGLTIKDLDLAGGCDNLL